MAGFLAAWCLGLFLLLPSPAARAAVGAGAAEKLRRAIRLPEVSLSFEFGFTQVTDWHGDDDLPDPAGEIATLRKGLTGGLGDAPILKRIAMVSRGSEPREQYRARLAEAFDVARRWVAEAPTDPAAQVNLADLHRLKGEFDEAGRILAPLTGEGSSHGAAFAALARVEIGRGDRIWFEKVEPGIGGVFTARTRPTDADLREARFRYSKAMEATSRAVALEPDEARNYLLRVRIRALTAMLGVMETDEPDQEKAFRRLMGAVLPNSAVPDLESASRVRPEDVRIQLGLVLHLASGQVGAIVAADRDSGPRDFLQLLDEPTREKVRGVTAKLDRLAGSDDPRLAAQALEALGLIRGMLSLDPAVTRELCVRSFRLDPRRGQAFDMAMAGIVTAPMPDWGLAEALVKERIRHDRGERMHLLLAKVLDQRDSGAAALDAMLTGLKEHPGSARLMAAEFCLRLKRPDPPGPVSPKELFERIQTRLKDEPQGPALSTLQNGLFVTVAIAVAVDGEVDDARRRIREFLASIPDDSYAQEVAALLREIPDP